MGRRIAAHPVWPAWRAGHGVRCCGVALLEGADSSTMGGELAWAVWCEKGVSHRPPPTHVHIHQRGQLLLQRLAPHVGAPHKRAQPLRCVRAEGWGV